MHQSAIDPVKYDLARPQCPKCGTRMWMTRIEPDTLDHEQRIFECPRCDHSLTETAKYR